MEHTRTRIWASNIKQQATSFFNRIKRLRYRNFESAKEKKNKMKDLFNFFICIEAETMDGNVEVLKQRQTRTQFIKSTS